MKQINAFAATFATGAVVAAAALLGAGTAAAAPTPGGQNGTVHAAPTGNPSHTAPHQLGVGNFSGRPIESTPDRQAGIGKQVHPLVPTPNATPHPAEASGGLGNWTGEPLATAAAPGKGPGHYAVIRNRSDYPHNIYITHDGVQQAANAGRPPVSSPAAEPGGVWHFFPHPRLAKAH